MSIPIENGIIAKCLTVMVCSTMMLSTPKNSEDIQKAFAAIQTVIEML